MCLRNIWTAPKELSSHKLQYHHRSVETSLERDYMVMVKIPGASCTTTSASSTAQMFRTKSQVWSNYWKNILTSTQQYFTL